LGISRQFIENNIGWLVAIGMLTAVAIGIFIYDQKHPE